MSYQLVLQFPGDSLADYRATVAPEEQLAEALGDSADVDGHDCGQGETNISIITDDPAGAFQQARLILDCAGSLASLRAAYRDEEGDDSRRESFVRTCLRQTSLTYAVLP